MNIPFGSPDMWILYLMCEYLAATKTLSAGTDVAGIQKIFCNFRQCGIVMNIP